MVDLNKIAESLWEAEENYKPIEQITKTYPDLSLDDAYKIQIINVKRRVSDKNPVTGKKIGLTSLAMQKSLGVDTPDFGFLYKSMEVQNGVVYKNQILQPRVEGELVFCLNKDLTGDEDDIDSIIEATEYCCPAFEIVGSRIKDWKLTLPDTVADNASCGMYMLADSVRIDPNKVDLRQVNMSLYKNGELMNQGKGDAVLGHPAKAVLWLSKIMAKYGVKLKKGDIILSGALTAAIPAEPGDSFVCDFEEFGKIKVDFEK